MNNDKYFLITQITENSIKSAQKTTPNETNKQRKSHRFMNHVQFTVYHRFYPLLIIFSTNF